MGQLINFKIMGERPVDPCVFQFEMGTKYFIWKGPDLMKTLTSQARDIERKVNGEKRIPGSLPKSDIFHDMIIHIGKYRTFDIRVYPLFSSQNINDLIEFEKEYLKKCLADPNCLNLNREPYFPKWVMAEIENSPQQKKIPNTVKTSTEPRKSPISNEKHEKKPEINKVILVENKDYSKQENSDFVFDDLDDIKALAKSLKK